MTLFRRNYAAAIKHRSPPRRSWPLLDPQDVPKKLNEYGIAVRSGHHCAQPILRDLALKEPFERRSRYTILMMKSIALSPP